MRKILFGITSLGFGGAERVLVDLSNKLSENDNITIFTIYDGGELKKQLDDRVKVISLYSKKYNDYTKIQHLKISLNLMFKTKIIGDYDVVVAFLEGPITRLFSKKIKGFKAKKVAWIHNDISKVFGTSIKAKIKRYVDKKIYKKYDNLIFVSNENKEDFDRLYHLYNKNENTISNESKIINKEDKIISDINDVFDDKTKQREVVIRNYLDSNRVIKNAKEQVDMQYSKESINLVSVCRLVEQKGLDRFIKVASRLKKDGYNFKIYIVGDGPLKNTLQKQIDDENLSEEFILLGAKENPYPYMKNADYFCLLSYYEGYGMVLDEAKILNKSIIITNTAAIEGIQDYENAVIAENSEDGIYETIKKILSK